MIVPVFSLHGDLRSHCGGVREVPGDCLAHSLMFQCIQTEVQPCNTATDDGVRAQHAHQSRARPIVSQMMLLQSVLKKDAPYLSSNVTQAHFLCGKYKKICMFRYLP